MLCSGLKSQVVLPAETVEELPDACGRCQKFGGEGPGHLPVISVRSRQQERSLPGSGERVPQCGGLCEWG